MFGNRLFQPAGDMLLYHYCSAHTLQAICQNKTVRLSDINMMNDFNEARYSYGVFEEAATELLNDPEVQRVFPDMDKAFFDRVDEIISAAQLHIHPVIACFSKVPDLLSQWHRYADDSRGFSVGLDAHFLREMPVTMLEVEYERAKQVAETREALAGIFMKNKAEGHGFKGEFVGDCAVFGTRLHAFKDRGFREEQEVRMLHVLDVVTDDDRPRLRDAGGEAGHRKVKGQPVRYRVSEDGSFVAYIDLPFPVKKGRQAIQELWLGPRNTNGPGNVLYMASECGWKGYNLHKSRIALR